jgi:hypothetical protein
VSISTRRRGKLAALSALAVSGLAPGLAHAANPKPCNGLPLLEDATEDSIVAPLGGVGLGARSHPGAPNTDIENAWLSWEKGADGKKALTANIQLSAVDMTVPAPNDSQGGIAYYVFYKDGDTVRFLRAQNQLGQGFTFAAGHIMNITLPSPLGNTTAYAKDADIPGKLFEGKDGVVQMTVPETAGAKAGATLGGVEAFADGFNGGPDDVSGFNNHFDAVPDEANPGDPVGVDYKVADCVPVKPAKARRARH